MVKRNLKVFVLCLALTVPLLFNAGDVFADTLGQRTQFSTNAQYDASGRSQINATLRAISDKAYFYVDDKYWTDLTPSGQSRFSDAISKLSNEFDELIYPKSTNYWGFEENPGIDGDPRITVLIEDMKSGFGGYFLTINGYARSEAPGSNQREMLYLNADSAFNPQINIFLGHEFQHLISFAQKENKYQVDEEVWLNELRSEYASDVIGYSSQSADSVLAKRIESFKQSPSDSLTEWPNVSLDYSQVALFGRYIAGHYPDILKETIFSSGRGASSINDFLARHGYKERFEDIFGLWAAANYFNSPSLDPRLTYKQDILKNIKIGPTRSTSVTEGTSYNFSYTLGPWQAYWHQIYNDSDNKKAIKITFDAGMKIMYVDNLGRLGLITSPAFVTNPSDGALRNFLLIPFHDQTGSRNLSVSLSYTDEMPTGLFGVTLENGMLVHKQGEPELYVIEGRYKRYLRPEIIKMYGHLDPTKAIVLDSKTFDSYISANYVRYVNDQKVYAVWPDGTKHWLRMSANTFTETGRDWNSIFIINEHELNAYKTGSDITR